ncbi:nitrogenase cofactor biosynthesis protein NifB [Gordonibacter sp. 28C]|uniref:nitrogenase cofactor biosynthesis protein NifB n=1 Tax=Gordonibacter sp. 28C TaxID=2078569 RepID=UPI000DF76F13|nr:nitrogenase cofactor biosynthesis protein NifB [Gordonibacter sp. 28C]RDB61828.1 nitrogenase cofactor biosynthesis protein NifB [Gordonibacter sp. 28C]
MARRNEPPQVKERGALVDLNVNPCKMCMPMGSSTAAFGVQGCVTILHGSQGCATYIRRHMATHYNEPVDIASSALTEQGTVYGGEGNLHKGIDNLIRLYDPAAICVSTTCLAETIGEDVAGMLGRWREKHPDSKVTFVPVASPGYGGSQFDGHFRFLRALMESVEMRPQDAPPRQLNLVCGPMSPADMRFLKRLVASFGIEAVVVPDLSENLDRARLPVYDRTPAGGTPLARIATMAGSALTIELATFVPDGCSPGAYLHDRFGVPCTRLNLPVGLRDIDALVDELTAFAGVRMPAALAEERGRYLDAMIDSHKYNAEGRAVVFGEPDFCYAAVRLCVENGVVPVVTAAGSRCPGFEEELRREVREAADRFLVDRWEVLEDADFGDIERLAVELRANVMIGSSDGRRIEDARGIPLVRCAFPIHDHVGGQRVRTLGYEGSLTLLDRITNALLQRKEEGFRAAIRDEFYDNTLLSQAHRHRESASHELLAEANAALAEDRATAPGAAQAARPAAPGAAQSSLPVILSGARSAESKDPALALARKTAQHPCFNGGCASENARIHLAVAPACNISCNYCVRKFDCANESRPGVASAVLSPNEAFERYRLAKERVPNLTTVGVAGPGDALADWERTRATLELVAQDDPDMTFCLSTNGLLLPRFADDIARLGVTHVTVTMNAVDPAVAGRIYRFARLDGVTYTGEAAGAVLLANQIAGIKRLVELGVAVKVNTVLVAGVNDGCVEDVGALCAKLGAAYHNVMQHIPVAGSVFGDLPQVSRTRLDEVRKRCEAHLPQMYHCRQCRADAVGKLSEDLVRAVEEAEGRRAAEPVLADPVVATLVVPRADGARTRHAPLRIAVASRSGSVVDAHFGQAASFMVYETDGTVVRYVETRETERYCTGQEACDPRAKADRLERSLAAVRDCAAVLALRIGQAPADRLRACGIAPVCTCDAVRPAVLAAAAELSAGMTTIEFKEAASL